MNSVTIGERSETKPDGMLRAITFPQLALMDVPTGDGRLLDSAGAGTRELPRPIFFQKTQAPGHDGSVAVGRIDEVTFAEDENGRKVASGKGWLIDSPEGREAALFVRTQTIFHNSVDLNDVRVRFELVETSEDDLDVMFRFTEWRIGGTTLVGSPAFADAHAVMDEEMKASMLADESELIFDGEMATSFDCAQPEMVADGGTRVAWSDFHIPEPNHRQKIVVEEDGRVYGHLAIWDEPHEGFPDRRRFPPRPGDGYASFNQPGPLTEHGQVETGPIFLLGGHPDAPLGNADPYKAYGGVENCWADVRVSAGVFGPWISGRVRPGVDDKMLYAARASRISGHWVGDRLRAITSCNVEGFPVGGSGVVGEVAIRDGEVLELVASYGGDFDAEEIPIMWSDLDDLASMLAPLLQQTIETSVELTETMDMWTAEELADAVAQRLSGRFVPVEAVDDEPVGEATEADLLAMELGLID